MKSFVVALCVIAVAAATSDKDAQVVRSQYEQTPGGDFQYVYESDNGINGQASGVVKNFGKDESALEVQGSNSYISPEGELISLTWVANENGFQPKGAHLPTTPPTPEYIAKAIAYNLAHPYDEKKYQ